MNRRPPKSTLFPYTTLSRSRWRLNKLNSMSIGHNRHRMKPPECTSAVSRNSRKSEIRIPAPASRNEGRNAHADQTKLLADAEVAVGGVLLGHLQDPLLESPVASDSASADAGGTAEPAPHARTSQT